MRLPQFGLEDGLGRIPQLLTIAVVVAVAVVNLRWALDGISFNDVEAYWSAAMRVREGEPLYPAFTNIDRAEVYRYSPWFAWLWIPLTYLPRWLATAVWEAILTVAAAYVLVRMVRLRAWLAIAFFGPVIVDSVLGANVQTLLVALLLWGVERRAGPLCIAVAASLKAVPILFVLVYIGRREWRRAAATIVMSGVLASPFLMYDLSSYTTDPGSYTLIWGTALYWPLVLLSAGSAVLLAHTPYRWLAASTAVLLSLPRVWFYNLTFVVIGIAAVTGWQEPMKSRLGEAPGEVPERRRGPW